MKQLNLVPRLFRRERTELKRRKYLNKPCPQFSTTGALSSMPFPFEEGDVFLLNNNLSPIFLSWIPFLFYRGLQSWFDVHVPA